MATPKSLGVIPMSVLHNNDFRYFGSFVECFHLDSVTFDLIVSVELGSVGLFQ